MSRSSPGRYALHEFAINVFDLQASDGAGRALAIEHPVPHRGWSRSTTVRSGCDIASTEIAWTEPTWRWTPPTHTSTSLQPSSGPAGSRTGPRSSRSCRPSGSGWRVATQLFPTANPFAFTAPNLAYLADSPIEASRHMLRTFRAPAVPGPGAGPPMALALHADGVGDADAEAHVQGSPADRLRGGRDLRRVSAVRARELHIPGGLPAVGGWGRDGTPQQHRPDEQRLVGGIPTPAARHGGPRVLPRVERGADPAPRPGAVRPGIGEHIGRTVARRGSHDVTTRSWSCTAPACRRSRRQSRSGARC